MAISSLRAKAPGRGGQVFPTHLRSRTRLISPFPGVIAPRRLIASIHRPLSSRPSAQTNTCRARAPRSHHRPAARINPPLRPIPHSAIPRRDSGSFLVPGPSPARPIPLDNRRTPHPQNLTEPGKIVRSRKAGQPVAGAARPLGPPPHKARFACAAEANFVPGADRQTIKSTPRYDCRAPRRKFDRNQPPGKMLELVQK